MENLGERLGVLEDALELAEAAAHVGGLSDNDRR